MIPPIAIENEVRLVIDFLLVWAVVAGPIAVLFCVWVKRKKL
jgi:hypothetical protein